MPESPSPIQIFRAVESLAPGWYFHFLSRVGAGVLEGTVLTSWWRSPTVNRDAGGDPLSQHLLGFAMDLQSREDFLLAAKLNQLGLVAIEERDHVHVQLFPRGFVAPLVRAFGLEL